jgi:RNA polymerase sigma-70 factor (ECF subfamily)
MLRASWRPWLPGAVEAESAATVARPDLRALLDRHHAEIWRVVRRLGVPDAAAEDVAQQVFVVAASKLDSIEKGRERAFLFGVAVRLASNHRKKSAFRNESASDEMDELVSEAPHAEELLDRKQLRQLLDEVLDSLPQDLRTVLVLFELEELRLEDIARVLGIPRGTAASRLRRAREAFDEAAKRARARHAFSEGS